MSGISYGSHKSKFKLCTGHVHGHVHGLALTMLTFIHAQRLNYFISHFPLLRFIFTTRPDAACGGIRSILERSFPSGSIEFLVPEDLRVDDAKAEVTLPLTIDTPKGTNMGDQEVKSSSGSRVMVLETVLKECGLIPLAGATKDTPDSSAFGSQLPEVERQRWMQVRPDRQHSFAPYDYTLLHPHWYMVIVLTF